MARTTYQPTVARYYRLDPETWEMLRRIVEADGTIETETYRRLIREETVRRGLAAADNPDANVTKL